MIWCSAGRLLLYFPGRKIRKKHARDACERPIAAAAIRSHSNAATVVFSSLEGAAQCSAETLVPIRVPFILPPPLPDARGIRRHIAHLPHNSPPRPSSRVTSRPAPPTIMADHPNPSSHNPQPPPADKLHLHSPDEEDESSLPPCLACLDAPARCELHPCMHRVMCVRCSVSLEAAICPACRHPVVSLLPLELPAITEPIPFADIQRARTENDEVMRSNTLQIVFAAVPDARIETQNLIDVAIQSWPLPSTLSSSNALSPSASASIRASSLSQKNPTLCGLFRFLHASKRALGSPASTASTATAAASKAPNASNIVSPASDLPLPNPFAANAVVSGKKARFSLFALPAVAEGRADVRAVASLLRARRPDFVFIAAPAQPRESARACLDWDARLRSVLGAAELPRRSWLLVAADDPKSTASKFTPDVIQALEACPVRERPSGPLRVAAPVSQSHRNSARFAKAAVKYAARARAAQDPRGCTHSQSSPSPAASLPPAAATNTNEQVPIRGSVFTRIGQSLARRETTTASNSASATVEP